MDKLYCGDNLDVMTKKISRKSIDLIYLDPPFFGVGGQYQIIWNDKNEIKQCKERTKLGIDGYINWIEPRLYVMRELLKSTGSIYLHCDYRMNAHMRILMDEIFGLNNFNNEIIWSYTGRENPRQKMFPRKHENILFFKKNKGHIFNMIFKPYRQEYIEFFKFDDDDGRGKYRIQPKVNGQYKQYLNESKGQAMNDVWNDIKPLYSFGCQHERLDYSTQKPEALLERIIKASSNEGDIVLDPFMGGGTTLSVAKKLGRQFVGIDIAEKACNVTADRIEYPKSNIINTIRSIPDFDIMETYEFQAYVCKLMGAFNTSPDDSRPSGPDGGPDGKFIGEWKDTMLSVTVSKIDMTEVKECIMDALRRGFKRAMLISRKPITDIIKKRAEEYAQVTDLDNLELEYIGNIV